MRMMIIGETIELEGRPVATIHTGIGPSVREDLIAILDSGTEPEDADAAREAAANAEKVEAYDKEVTDLRDALMGVDLDAATTPEEMREAMQHVSAVTLELEYVSDVRGEVMSLLSAVKGRLDADRLTIEDMRREIEGLKETAAVTGAMDGGTSQDAEYIEALKIEIETLSKSAHAVEDAIVHGLNTRIADLEADLAAATDLNKRLTSQAGAVAIETGKETDLRDNEIAVLRATVANNRGEMDALRAKVEQAERRLEKGRVVGIEVADDNMTFVAGASRLFTYLLPRAATLDKATQAHLRDMVKAF